MVNDTQMDDRTTAMLASLDQTELTPPAVALRDRSYELLRLPPGAAVADVGCGAGRAAVELAGRGFAAAGVDPDANMLAIARQRYPDVRFVRAGAEALPFEDGELHGYRADKVLHALKSPADAVAEASRVLAPDGRIVLIGQDWDTIAVDADDLRLTRTIMRCIADSIPSPTAARGFRALLVDAGFADVEVDAVPMLFEDGKVLGPMLRAAAGGAAKLGLISEDEGARWLADQDARHESGRTTICATIYVAAGSRR
jgi:SAM-dependent methyltransferase